MLGITIKISAAQDTVSVDGQTFDRAAMTKPEKHKLTRLVTAFAQQEYKK